jgi:hypothetical protein
VGVLLFKNIFRLAGPAAGDLSKLFKFGREPGFSLDKLDDCAGLKVHGKSVVDTVSAAVSLLTKLDELVPILLNLGKRHAGYGVVEGHYPVVGGALLATLEQGLPKEKWTPEAKAAYAKMWDVIQAVMLSEAKAPDAKPAPTKPEAVKPEPAKNDSKRSKGD